MCKIFLIYLKLIDNEINVNVRYNNACISRQYVIYINTDYFSCCLYVVNDTKIKMSAFGHRVYNTGLIQYGP